MFELWLSRRCCHAEQVAVDVRPYLAALREIEKQGVMCSASLVLHPNGDGAVMLENLLQDKRVAVDFEDGDDIMTAIERLAERAKTLLEPE